MNRSWLCSIVAMGALIVTRPVQAQPPTGGGTATVPGNDSMPAPTSTPDPAAPPATVPAPGPTPNACLDSEARAKALQSKLADANTERARALSQRSACDLDLDVAKKSNVGLHGLLSYLLGETTELPRVTGLRGAFGSRSLDQLIASGRGAELINRRLLVEALREVAPIAWGEVSRGGPPVVDEFFGTPGPLPVGLLKEVQTLVQESLSQPNAVTSLVRAQRLVHAYQALVRCSDTAQINECGAARKLSQLIDTRGPLMLTHRIQRVWETPCSAVNRDVTASWVQAAPHGDGGKNLADAVGDKLFGCFLDDPPAGDSFSAWALERLPPSADLDDRARSDIAATASRFPVGSLEDRCARAARALQTMDQPASCELDAARLAQLGSWSEHIARAEDTKSSFALRTCTRYTRALFTGSVASIPDRFDAPPGVDQVVQVVEGAPTKVGDLRAMCRDRRTLDPASFPGDVAAIATVARGFGETPAADPWWVDAVRLEPIERLRADKVTNERAWLENLAAGTSTCSALSMEDARCQVCRAGTEGLYDCSLLTALETDWSRRTRRAGIALAASLALLLLAVWFSRWVLAYRRYGRPLGDVRGHLERIGVAARSSVLRRLFPSRLGELEFALPEVPAWERWGSRGLLVLGRGANVAENDVHLAGAKARNAGAEVAVIVHEDGASADLGGVRAVLDWAARGKTKAVQVLLLSMERLRWASSPEDLLDLVEESSLRGNPFEVRGRITSSSQFFNRERLVSGLLASVHAGRWVVVTGLRRFGKSSLTLEVARRVPGPYAYVDLAGFHHEIAFNRDPSVAANAILRHVCAQLALSARSKLPGGTYPEAPPKGAEVDAAELGDFFRQLGRAVADENRGRPLPAMIILDEIEQAIGVGAERIGHAIDVLAIVMGRLRNALGDEARPSGARVGVVLASALHPVLWAPLDVLAHQSIMASFESVFVSALPTDAARTMMRSLGARQGIRFTDEALEHLVAQSQGMPLILRRLGSATLGLYDGERAQQGALGAVNVGIEGARLAVEREEQEGSPVRVWVESEIASPADPAGILLRALAGTDRISSKELRALAARVVLEQFRANGIDRRLSAGELERRAQEAASVLVRLLGATGLLVPHGDLIDPESFELPASSLRRILTRE